MKKVTLAIFGLFLVTITSCKKAENNLKEQHKTLVVSTLAGSGATGDLDANGPTAQFSSPQAIAIDPSGNAYITDYFNHKIKKITPEGMVTTFAGSIQGFAEGTGTASQFSYPTGIVCDANGNLYVADSGNARIRKITPAGVVSTYAGSGIDGYEDGAALSAQFLFMRFLAIDASNNLYVADNGNNRIRKVSSTGQVTTVAGSGGYGYDDGPVATANIGEPIGVTIDPAGNLYVSQAGDFGYIRKISNGQVVKITGMNLPTDYLDGIAGIARVSEPGNLRSDANGNIYIVDAGNGLIRKYDPNTNSISTYAGAFNYVRSGSGRERIGGVFKDGPANEALFNAPADCLFNSKGDLFIVEQTNNMVRKVSSVELTLPESDLEKKNWNKPTTWK